MSCCCGLRYQIKYNDTTPVTIDKIVEVYDAGGNLLNPPNTTSSTDAGFGALAASIMRCNCAELQDILTKLNEDCTGDPINVNICNTAGVAPGNFTESVLVVTAAGVIPANLHAYSITNIGTMNGTVDGQTFPPTATVGFEAYLDPTGDQYIRPSGIPYDATNTQFLITLTP